MESHFSIVAFGGVPLALLAAAPASASPAAPAAPQQTPIVFVCETGGNSYKTDPYSGAAQIWGEVSITCYGPTANMAAHNEIYKIDNPAAGQFIPRSAPSVSAEFLRMDGTIADFDVSSSPCGYFSDCTRNYLSEYTWVATAGSPTAIIGPIIGLDDCFNPTPRSWRCDLADLWTV